MKRMLRLAAAAPLLALAGCTANGPTPESTVGAVADTITIKSTQALILAELSYRTLAPAVAALARADVLKGEDATKARALNLKITAALEGAKTAQSAIVQATETAKAITGIADLETLRNEVQK